MIRSPFPSYVGFSCKCENDYPSCVLDPAEAKALSAGAVVVRRVHYTLGRAAAHEALAAIGADATPPILSGARREPIWPPGIVGAITHAGAFACAAVARTQDSAGLGLDIEQHTRLLSEDISRQVCTTAEVGWLNSGRQARELRLNTIFSAKESIFKATYPLGGVFLDFLDAELTWDGAAQHFIGRLLKAVGADYPAGTTLTVGCQIIDAYVLTSTVLPPRMRSG